MEKKFLYSEFRIPNSEFEIIPNSENVDKVYFFNQILMMLGVAKHC